MNSGAAYEEIWRAEPRVVRTLKLWSLGVMINPHVRPPSFALLIGFELLEKLIGGPAPVFKEFAVALFDDPPDGGAWASRQS
jgi:hypothetical protein